MAQSCSLQLTVNVAAWDLFTVGVSVSDEIKSGFDRKKRTFKECNVLNAAEMMFFPAAVKTLKRGYIHAL